MPVAIFLTSDIPNVWVVIIDSSNTYSTVYMKTINQVVWRYLGFVFSIVISGLFRIRVVHGSWGKGF